jgi:hypothetical protein
VLQLTVAGSSSGMRRRMPESGSRSVPPHGATQSEVAGGSCASAALVARRVESSDGIRGTIVVAFIASTTEVPAAPKGPWASAARYVCGAPHAGTILTAT